MQSSILVQLQFVGQEGRIKKWVSVIEIGQN